MGIEIESPSDFLDDYKDSKSIPNILNILKNRTFEKKVCKNLNPALQETIHKAQQWLLNNIQEKKYWNAPIESNPGLSAQFILMSIGMNEGTNEEYHRLFSYILSQRNEQGLIGLYYAAKPHPSSNLLAYLAGRILGFSKESPELSPFYNYLQTLDFNKAINMETKLLLALYGLISWDCIPEISPLLMLIPDEAEFSIYSIAYWVRTSLVPMAVLQYKKYSFPNFPLSPDEILEFTKTPLSPYPRKKNHIWENFFKKIRQNYSLEEKALHELAIKRCEQWILRHQDPCGDWGGIYPAMQYSIISLYCLGYPITSPEIKKGMEGLRRFQHTENNMTAELACVSPVWDTAWSIMALSYSGFDMADSRLTPIYQWLIDNQINQEGDWAIHNKTGFGGGWAFQFSNNWYPDTDDSAVVIMALLQNPNPTDELNESLQRGLRWLMTMQNLNGGWSAFEQGVDDDYVDLIPFNDMENWKDQSTSDVTGRCLQMLGMLGVPEDVTNVKKAIHFIKREQEKNGSWYGRWGVNYIYGTCSTVLGLAQYARDEEAIQKACDWLVSIQNEDGGWGESCDSYDEVNYVPLPKSIPSQTAWALLTLLQKHEQYKDSIERAVQWLISHQKEDGTWDEIYFTGTGFGKYFYLRYDYYRHYFPLLALGMYSLNS